MGQGKRMRSLTSSASGAESGHVAFRIRGTDRFRLNAIMTWKTVRLELASTPSFPRGSASRAFILRVPLDDEGLIDAEVLGENPARATARRYWSPEPDQFGRLERSDGHWLLRCHGPNGETEFQMTGLPLRLNREITIKEPSGACYPFRVASVRVNRSAVAATS